MDFIGIYGRIALEGGETRFEQDLKPANKYLSTYVYSPKHGEFTVIFSDITEQKLAEEALRQSEARRRVAEAVEAERQRFFNVLETLPALVWLLTPDYHVAFANRAACEKFGEVKGRLCYEACFGLREPCEFCETYNVLKTGKPVRWEAYPPDGSVVDVYDFPFTDVDGSPMILEMGVDITEFRKAEAELAEYRNHLEEIVKERTRQLEAANEQLHSEIIERKQAEEALCKYKNELEIRVQERTKELCQAKEELEVSNEELQGELEQHQKLEAQLMDAKEAAEEAAKVKAAFMANMSHELRTPMNSVIGFTGLLLEEPLTVEQKDYLESIRNSGQSLMTLINEVLDFSKMEREKMDLELQAFDLRSITEEALDMVAAQSANKGLELNYSFSKNVPEAIIGDPGKLRQVLGNLLSNAMKFTREGEVEVDVSSDPDQDEIHFAVRDTGIGISEEDIGKLFQPFSQLDLSYSRGFEGTGLGLAISRKLVELMGGRIWIESEEGIGSAFYFTIPAETAPTEFKPILTGGFEGKQVLIAVENQTLRRILCRQVHAWNIVPMMASNIIEAIELLQRDNGFDAVIIDASRDEVLSMIAEKRDRWRKLPFIALTTLGQRVPQNLFQAVLSKPLKPTKLLNALKDVLKKRNASEPTEVPEMEKSYGPLRILLAEDNLSNQKVTLEMLKKLGYRADAVVNGQEALEALERQPYDIVFMDVKMPLMNGIQAARKIRERWPENGPKIIAVTAYALHGDREKCLAAGMDGYIPKPVQKEDLARALKEIERL